MSAPVDVLAVVDRFNDGALAAYNKAAANALTDDEITEAVLLNEQLAQGLATRAAIAELIDAAKDAHYLGLMVGEDCTWMLAKLQREGVYKPTCSDGKPSRADAGQDYEKIHRCRTRLAAALRACGGA